MRRTLALAALLTAGAPAALAQSAPAQSSSPTAAPDWVDKVPASGAQATVTMLDAGAKPHRALRFAPQPGPQPAMEMRMENEQTMALAGMKMPLPQAPALVYSARVHVDEVQDDGDIAYTVTFQDIGIDAGQDTDPKMLAAMQEAISGVSGAKASLVVDARGATKESQLTMTPGPVADIAGQATRQFESIVAPLPAEPVGAGARWESYSAIEMDGMRIAQRAEYHLVEVDGDRIVLEATVDQAIVAFDFPMDGLPPGADVKLTAFDSAGSTRSVIDLGSLTPVESTSTVELSMAMEISEASMGTQTMAMTNKTVMTQSAAE